MSGVTEIERGRDKGCDFEKVVKTPNRTGLHYFLDTNANTAADFPVIICFPLSGIV